MNLIKYNPHRRYLFEASDTAAMKWFTQTLEEAAVETTIRFKKG